MGEVGSAGVENIKRAADFLPLDVSEMGMVHLVDEGWQLEKCWSLVGLMWVCCKHTSLSRKVTLKGKIW